MNLKAKKHGFTLIELVVTMGIMALITAVTLANHSKFGGQVTLRNLAYEMALVVREAQTYGVSVRKLNKNWVTDFNAGYGIHFDANNKLNYVMFSDTYKSFGSSEVLALNGTGDGIFNTELEKVTRYTLGRGYKLNKLCAGPVGSMTCVDVCDDTCTGSLDILFKRPEPDAAIRLNGVENILYERAEIELTSPRDDTMRVLIEVSGQISVIK